VFAGMGTSRSRGSSSSLFAHQQSQHTTKNTSQQSWEKDETYELTLAAEAKGSKFAGPSGAGSSVAG
jgi:hypothetical protein